MLSISITITTEELARMFLEASDEEQALFFEEIAKQMTEMREKDREIVWSMQFDSMWEKMSAEARNLVKYLNRE